MPEILHGLVFVVLAAGGLLVPGWLLGRALGTPAGLPGAFLGSLALLCQILLLLDTAGLPLETRTVFAALAATALVLLALARRRGPLVLASPRPVWPRDPALWLLAPAALGFGAIAVRAALDPLSGYDHAFRWDFLARQLWQWRTLDFYPAVAASDFSRYAWCDGIAPLVAGQLFWSYLAWGAPDASATVPAVLLQAAVLYVLVFRSAARSGGRRAGCAAVALLSASSVLLWGVAMGQETGLTAIALVAVFHFIARHRDEPGRPWLVWAGVAAALGALAREYGLVFVLLGALALAGRNTSAADWCRYLGTAGALALPWYARNFFLTGNPLYNHEVAGLFPVNPVQAAYMRSVAEITAAGRDLGSWTRLLAILAGLSLAAGVIGGLAQWRRHGALLVAMAAVAALWWWSVAQTSGGFVYSLRVLTPLLALGAVAGGQWLATFARPRTRLALAALLTLAAADAAVRSLYLPIYGHVRWWENSAPGWLDLSRQAALWRSGDDWKTIAAAAAGRPIVVSDPSAHAILAGHRAMAIPLASPAVRFLFDPQLTLSDGAARLRTERVRFLLLTRHNPFNEHALGTVPFFRALAARPPTARTPVFDLYDLDVHDWLPVPPLRP